MTLAPAHATSAPRAAGPLPVAVAGLGAYLPPEVVTNDDWARTLATSDGWIRSRTGIAQRHFAAAGQATSDLAAEAGKAALADAGLAVDEVGAVVLATTTPDQPIPGSAPQVAARLGTTAAAFDVNAACSGFVVALRVAAGIVATGSDPVLVIGAETLSRAVDPDDRSTAVLFGDGAGAVVLVPDAGARLGPFDVGADGNLADILITPGGGTRRPFDAAVLDERAHYLTMRGREVYRHAVARMAASASAVLDAAGLEVDDVDLVVGHQANRRILDALAQRLDLDLDRLHVTVDRHGNTSAASVPLALADARDAGRLKPGDRVLLTAFGAGLTWASCLLTWGRGGPSTTSIRKDPA